MSTSVPDLIVVGRLLTMDPACPEAGALAVRDGRIVGVGSRDEILALRGPHSRVADYGDACVLPGFVDPHTHFEQDIFTTDGPMVSIRATIAPRAEDVLAIVHRTIAERGSRGAFLGGWDAQQQKGLPKPTLEWLDAAAPDTPLCIMHSSAHMVWFNSAAARAAGMSRSTPDPARGHFGRTPTGELDGAAYEKAVLSVLEPLMRDQICAEFPSGIAAAAKRASAAGVTTATEMNSAPELRSALLRQTQAGELTVRLRLYQKTTPERQSATKPFGGNDRIRQIGVKIWADGSPGTGTIAATFPYLDTAATRALGLPPGHTCAPTYTTDELYEVSEAYFDQGWQIATHVEGDAAADRTLDAWERLLRRPGSRRDHRLRLEHCVGLRPDQFQRAADLGVTCSFFPGQLHYQGEAVADDLFGPEVADEWVPMRSALDAGVRISMHSDTPVTPLHPLRNIATAVTRRTRAQGRILGAHQALTVEEALRAHTIDAAWQLFADDVVGSLTPGKYADLAVIEADPRTVAPDHITDLAVTATYLSGELVHERT